MSNEEAPHTKAELRDSHQNPSKGRGLKEEKSKWQKCLYFVKHAEAEVIMGSFSLYYYMIVVFIQAMVKQKLCRQHYPLQYCNPMNETIVDDIQEDANRIFVNMELIRTTPSIILCLILGYWSDVHGRKFLMLLPLLGNALTAGLCVLSHMKKSWPAETLYYAMIPAGLSGEYSGFMLGMYGWIKDTYPEEKLGLKIALVGGVEMTMAALAPVAGGQVYEHIGFVAVFMVCAVALGIGFLVTLFLLKENFPKSTWSKKIFDFINLTNLMKTVRVILVKRPNNKRIWVILVLISMIPVNIGFFGHMTIIANYVEKKFLWDVVMTSNFNTVQGIFQALGCFVVVPVLNKQLGIGYVWMTTIGCLSYTAFYLGTAFSTSTIAMFVVTVIQAFAIIALVSTRTLANVCVENHEAGKLNSIIAVVQAAGRQLGSVIGLQIYNMTFKTFAGAFYIMAGALPLITISIYGYLYEEIRTLEVESIIEKQSKAIPRGSLEQPTTARP